MRSAIRTFFAALAVAFVLPSEQAAALEVFANTGPGNTGPNISGPTPSIYSLAQGFVTGSTSYQLQSVQMVFNFTSPDDIPPFPGMTADQYLRIDLYNSTGQVLNSSTPTGSSIASFSSTPVEGFTYNQQTKYTFNVTAAQALAANTAYWVVVSAQRYDSPVFNPSFNWGFAEGSVDPPIDPSADKPVGKNGSGYSYLGTFGQQTSGGTWVNYNVSGNMASGVRIGVIVVPEPSTYALGIAGTLVMGSVARRKSRKTASA